MSESINLIKYNYIRRVYKILEIMCYFKPVRRNPDKAPCSVSLDDNWRRYSLSFKSDKKVHANATWSATSIPVSL